MIEDMQEVSLVPTALVGSGDRGGRKHAREPNGFGRFLVLKYLPIDEI